MSDPIYGEAIENIYSRSGVSAGLNILLIRTIPFQLFVKLLRSLLSIDSGATITVLTALPVPAFPIPREQLSNVKVIQYPFGPYFEYEHTPREWYGHLAENHYDFLVIPYPTNVLVGYDNVKKFIAPFNYTHYAEIGCGGNVNLQPKTALLNELSQPPASIGAIVDWKPSYITINITEHCNLRCVMCDIDDEGNYPHMPFDVFVNVARQVLPSCRVLTLNGFVGEPLLHPQFSEIIAFIDEHWPHLSVGFATNATALSQKRIDTLLNSHTVKDVRISMSAANRDTYEAIMKRACFNDTMKKLEKFMAQRQIHQANHDMVVTFSFVAMQQNIEELPQFIRMAASMGADQVLVWDVQISQAENVAYSLRNDNQRMAEVFTQCREVAKKNNINVLLPDVCQSQDELSGSAGGENQAFRCLLPWSHLYVSPNGEVAPCCFYNKTMGNLINDPLETVWNSTNYQQLRHATDQGRYPVPCQACPENRSFARGQAQVVFHKNLKSKAFDSAVTP